MPGLLTAIAPESARGGIVRDVAEGSARDAAAARVIAEAAESGNEGAEAFADEAQELLGAAAIRRSRADRLRCCAAKAAVQGHHRLAAIGSDAALTEEREADRIEGAVIGAVRQSHAPGVFGYVSPEEKRLLARKSSMENMSSGQLEQTFSDMLNNMYTISGANFGGDDPEDDEIDDVSAEKLAIAAEVFGGDLPAVFGTEVYAGFFDAFKRSREGMKKRLKAKQERLFKLEEKLESLEDDDKSGAQVKLLRMRVGLLEKGIARLKKKLGSIEDAGEEMADSAKKARRIQTAETQLLKEAIDTKPELSPEPLDDLLSDEELNSASDLFGATPRRARAVRRRMKALRRRGGAGTGRRLQDMTRSLSSEPFWQETYLDEPMDMSLLDEGQDDGLYEEEEGEGFDMMGRRGGGFRRGGFRRGRRARRGPRGGRGWGPGPGPGYFYPAGYAVYPDPYLEDLLAQQEDDLLLDDDLDDVLELEGLGSSNQVAPGRRVFIGFFQRRAQRYGSASVDPDSYGAGFLQSISDWFSSLWGSAKQTAERRKSAADAARAARAPYTPAVKEARGRVAESLKVLSQKGKTRRKAGRQAFKESWQDGAPAGKSKKGGRLWPRRSAESGTQSIPAKARVVEGRAGYVYQQNADGSIKILKDPTGRASGRTLTKGASWSAITNEIGPVGSAAYAFGGGR